MIGIRLAREWNQAQTPNSLMLSHARTSSGRNRQPHLALADAATCKSDAGWNKHTRKAGIAWIITGAANNLLKKESVTKRVFKLTSNCRGPVASFSDHHRSETRAHQAQDIL